MLAETLEEKEASGKDSRRAVVESNNKIRALYEPMITSPEERTLYNEWSKTWDAFKQGAQEVMALSRKAVGKIPTEAHDLNAKTVEQDRDRSR